MDTLNIAGLSLVLRSTPDGPLLSTKNGEWEPLAWVINAALTGNFPQLADALERGADAVVQGLYAVRPNPLDSMAEVKARWKAATGTDVGDDFYVVGTTFIRDEVVISRNVLQEILSTLQLLRKRSAQPGVSEQSSLPSPPWLFRPDPFYPDPAGSEEVILQDLEERAVALDALAQGPKTVETAATAAAKRRFLLVELAAAGLLSDAHSQQKLSWLKIWNLPTLSGYYDAALELLSYFRSPERQHYIPGVGAEPILGARVSVDWFRLGVPTPGEYHPYMWLGYCESIFREASLVEGGEGDMFTRIDEKWYRFHWRKDDGTTPVLLTANPV